MSEPRSYSHSYCSERSLAAGESMAGTADEVDVWILLEYRPTWTAKATLDNALSGQTRAWLDGLLDAARARGLKARLQFIRQPEIERGGVVLLVGHADQLHRIDAPDYATLATFTLDAVLATQPIVEPQYFVCTNGQRDLCCARFGLPVYAALRERVGSRVWQTTHVGGHRFASNVLSLPQGVLYGRLASGDLDEFVDAVDRNCLAARWLRGRTRYSPAVQAAEAALAQRGLDTQGPVVCVTEADGLRVSFGANSAVVLPGEPSAVFASCDDAQPKSVTPWQVRVLG